MARRQRLTCVRLMLSPKLIMVAMTGVYLYVCVYVYMQMFAAKYGCIYVCLFTYMFTPGWNDDCAYMCVLFTHVYTRLERSARDRHRLRDSTGLLYDAPSPASLPVPCHHHHHNHHTHTHTHTHTHILTDTHHTTHTFHTHTHTHTHTHNHLAGNRRRRAERYVRGPQGQVRPPEL